MFSNLPIICIQTVAVPQHGACEHARVQLESALDLVWGVIGQEPITETLNSANFTQSVRVLDRTRSAIADSIEAAHECHKLKSGRQRRVNALQLEH